MGRGKIAELKAELKAAEPSEVPLILYEFNARHCSFYDQARAPASQDAYATARYGRGLLSGVILHVYRNDQAEPVALVASFQGAEVVPLSSIAEPTAPDRVQRADNADAGLFNANLNDMKFLFPNSVAAKDLVFVSPRTLAGEKKISPAPFVGIDATEDLPPPTPTIIGVLRSKGMVSATVRAYVLGKHILPVPRDIEVPYRSLLGIFSTTNNEARVTMNATLQDAMGNIQSIVDLGRAEVQADGTVKVDAQTPVSIAEWRSSITFPTDTAGTAYAAAVNSPVLQGYASPADLSAATFDTAIANLNGANTAASTRAALTHARTILYGAPAAVSTTGTVPGSGLPGGGATPSQEAALRTEVARLSADLVVSQGEVRRLLAEVLQARGRGDTEAAELVRVRAAAVAQERVSNTRDARHHAELQQAQETAQAEAAEWQARVDRVRATADQTRASLQRVIDNLRLQVTELRQTSLPVSVTPGSSEPRPIPVPRPGTTAINAAKEAARRQEEILYQLKQDRAPAVQIAQAQAEMYRLFKAVTVLEDAARG